MSAKKKAANQGGPNQVVGDDGTRIFPRADLVKRHNSNLAQALGYVGRGWPVFPLMPNKKEPMTTNGFYDATLDEFAVRRWWSDHPQAGVAVRTGRASGLLAVCPDQYLTECRWPDLEREHGGITTYRDQSPRGGEHLLFKMPARVKIKNSSDNDGPITGVDIRSDGAYVIMPPSTFQGRRYQNLCDAPPARLPKWLRNLLLETPPRKTSQAWLGKSARAPFPTCVTSQLNSVSQAVAFSTPKKVGETNVCLFLLARGLLNVELALERTLTEGECSAAFDLWFKQAHSLLRESRAYYQAKFWRDRREARFALSAGSVRAAWFAACQQPSPPEARLFPSSEARRLCALCWQLEQVSQATGTPWFLSVRTTARLLGRTPMTACRYLAQLREAGVLEITTPHTLKLARCYRYIPVHLNRGAIT